jgi:hypothetical protein
MGIAGLPQRPVRRRVAGLACVLAAFGVLGGACPRREPPPPQPPPLPANGPEGTPSLAPPTPSSQRMVGGEPRGALHAIAPNLLARTRFVADRAGPLAVEIWDLTLAPGKAVEKTRLPGGAVIEVRSGAGTALIGGRRSELRIGATLTVDDGADLSLSASGADQPLILRATIIHRGGS